jgi:DNA-binding beta-propeller fold protein YncE
MQHDPNKARFSGMGLCGLMFLLSACVSAPPPTAPERLRLWPEPPDAARIAFVQSITRPEDLGITKGFFRRLLELLIGQEDMHLVRPMAVVTTADGMLYIADPGVKGVHRLDTTHGRYALIQRAEEAPLPSPVGLALGPDGTVYVTDSYLNGVFRISPGAKVAVPLAFSAALHQPTGIALDPQTGRFYVADTANHAVKIFERDGTFVQAFGARGAADGQFNFPTMLWRDPSGRLLVTDSLNFRIQVFSADGKYLSKFGRLGDGSGDHARPKGVATDRLGHVYVVDSLFHTLQVFDVRGAFLLNVGSQGRDAGEFWLPTGLFIAPDDRIYVADSHNQRVQVFRYIGGQP